MEEKINVAEILKDKPQGTKLWTDMLGEVTLYVVTNTCDAFQVKHHNKEPWFDENGKMYKEGALCIYPSKSMRDWSKFAWKKGDVLVSKDDVHIIFEKFEDDAYTRFKGKHYLWKKCGEEDYNKEETKMLTSVFEKATDDVAQTYIKTIEEHLDGKLNRETLEIEKPKQEFKDGDIVVHEESHCIYLLEKWDYIMNRIFYHARLDIHFPIGLEYSLASDYLEYPVIRLATDSEKQELFSALEKKNKRWNPDTKSIEDLPKKCEFKPFDKVLARNNDVETWIVTLFGFYDKEFENYVCIGDVFEQCIPYNKETAHLLGTTDKWAGGE